MSGWPLSPSLGVIIIFDQNQRAFAKDLTTHMDLKSLKTNFQIFLSIGILAKT